MPLQTWSAARYLAARARFGVKLGLDSTRALMRELGDPQNSFVALLVAGTNGKGSVTAYVDAALRASGLRVGRYTSPHLVRINERIAVNGTDISDALLARVLRAVRDAAQALVERHVLEVHPTYFEVTTAAAFEYFRRKAVDVAVLEVGMGGRLDATNISEPVASAIVTVDWDHQAHLGRTLAAIAKEKAGVMRPGRVTVLGPLPKPAARTIAARARTLRARIVAFDNGARVEARGEYLDIHTPRRSYRGLRPLPGRHQRDNLLVAVRLLEAAAEAGVSVDFKALPAATRGTEWPGRLQWLPGRPPLLLDGAHNPAGARALAAHLRNLGSFVLLFGAMEDKDARALARPLFPLADAVVLTRARIDRAAAPLALARRTAGLAHERHVEPQLRRALALAKRLAGPDRPVVVAGSLFLVGDVLRLRGWRTGERTR